MNPLKKPKANLKRKIARTTGVPTTKTGRKRKFKSYQGYLVIGIIVALMYFLNGFSGL
ncbi:hypothetical protein [Vibrio parahaemolyticus]|uniref:hypothetical protein n=1 Tax=Vibrio parahaemolyticus TaxID=670 RepID=UPI00145AA7CE|nr:hypothetical protein [Vibrio parahaemolyticus]EGQ8179461.1 hypothetical protein [Vibrio parahaemolyticus]EIW7861611.1 hypothetical protein [Vibrio parahaemolyticus]EKB1988256.1 hypothetical protein [Vibrio parahaemolyticus]EME0131965.1 hypothetical protein [Vibrio parahaemolyticus]EMF1839240.1 hypothetical protein [Vibrio parahaemolyticus]